MNDSRSLAIWVSMGGIVSAAVWGAIGGGGADSASLYEWIEWFVFEGPAPAALLGLVVALSIIAVFKYNRYFATRDVGHLRGCIGTLVVEAVIFAVEVGICLLRAGLI